MRRLAPLLLLAIAACTPARVPVVSTAPPEHAPPAPFVDLVRVDKTARTLEVWSGGRLVRSFGGIQLGWAPVGAKRFEGDGRTPEGRYTIDWRNPRSAFHLSLHISYPNAQDSAYAAARGHSAGGLIMIHGQPNGATRRREGDWTDGCIAVSDAQIEALWDIVPDGTPVEIVP
jgi:murein L,D-transpeptidase YafK